MPVNCEQLCGSFSCHRLCQIIAKTDAATYLVILISGVSAILSFVLSVTQIKSSDGMADVCTNNYVIESLSPFSVSGTKDDLQCFGYCSWPSNNTNLRLTSLSFFIMLMIAMIYAMNKMKFIWLIRILLFITLTLLFAALVEDFSSLIAGKKVCDNDFKIIQNGEDMQILYFICDEETYPIDTCSLEPYIYTILADMFVVIMCGALWQLIGHYKTIKTEAEVMKLNNNNSITQQQEQQVEVRDDRMGNVESEGVGTSTVNNSNVGDSTKNHNPFMEQYEDY